MAVTQKDTTFTKIFVGGLPYHTTDQSLREFFETFGDIEEAVVITDRQTQKSRGYGFVTMADRVAAERACKDPNPVIDGRKANVNLAYLGAKPRVPPSDLSGFPFAAALKGYPGLMQGMQAGQYGVPQYVYPTAAYMAAAAAAATPGVQIPMAPHSPMSPTATAQSFGDYFAAAAYPNGQLTAAGYEAAAYPYTSAAGYVSPTAYTYATVPQTLTHPFAYQPQQLQERMQ